MYVNSVVLVCDLWLRVSLGPATSISFSKLQTCPDVTNTPHNSCVMDNNSTIIPIQVNHKRLWPVNKFWQCVNYDTELGDIDPSQSHEKFV